MHYFEVLIRGITIVDISRLLQAR